MFRGSGMTGMAEAIAGIDLGPVSVEETRSKLILGIDYGTTYTGNVVIAPTSILSSSQE